MNGKKKMRALEDFHWSAGAKEVFLAADVGARRRRCPDRKRANAGNGKPMMWSKLKKTAEALFAPSLGGRVELHTTRYRYTHDQRGRGWITINGVELWSMEDFEAEPRDHILIETLHAETGLARRSLQTSARACMAAEGTFGMGGFHESLLIFIGSKPKENLSSPNILVRALSMIDRRVGIRRLERVELADEHAAVRTLHALRCEAERMARQISPS